MNKSELADHLGLSLGTISRYVKMDMPYEKVAGKYSFDLHEVEKWVSDNIDSRTPERFEQPEKMTPKLAARWAFETLERWMPYVDFKKMAKDLGVGNNIKKEVI